MIVHNFQKADWELQKIYLFDLKFVLNDESTDKEDLSRQQTRAEELVRGDLSIRFRTTQQAGLGQPTIEGIWKHYVRSEFKSGLTL